MSGDDPRVEAYTKGYKSKAKQARMQQARKHIADMVNEIAQAEAQANTMTGVFSQDPRYASIMGPIIKSNRERLYKANRRALELAYPDLINDSEFHEMMQQSMVDSVMGPTEPGGLSQQGLSATGSDPTAAMSQYGPYSQGYAMPGGDYPRQQAGSPTSNYWQTIRRGIGR
jgi:hypothetical protein